MKTITKIYKPLLILCLLLTAKASFAQDTVAEVKKSYFKVSAGYLTNAVYNGRQDTTKTPYINGSFGYYHKTGLSLSGSTSYNPNSGKVDNFSIDAGYSHDVSEKFGFSFDANKPFYNSSSTAVASGVKGSFGANITYIPTIISIDAGVNAVFSDKADIIANASIYHQFSIPGFSDGATWSITPTVNSNFGTQNFYNSYKARAARVTNVAATSTSVTSNSNFEVLDYELSLPISYDAKKWGISALPTYAIPEDPQTTTTTNTLTLLGRTRSATTSSTQALSNVFYAQFTVYFKF